MTDCGDQSSHHAGEDQTERARRPHYVLDVHSARHELRSDHVTLTVRQARRIFLRKVNLTDRQGFAIDLLVAVVGWLVAGWAGSLIGLLVSAALHFGVPWVGGRVISGRLNAELPPLEAKFEGTVVRGGKGE